jgi:hypothetical protein
LRNSRSTSTFWLAVHALHQARAIGQAPLRLHQERLNAGVNSSALLMKEKDRIAGLLLNNAEQAGLLAVVSENRAWRVV